MKISVQIDGKSSIVDLKIPRGKDKDVAIEDFCKNAKNAYGDRFVYLGEAIIERNKKVPKIEENKPICDTCSHATVRINDLSKSHDGTYFMRDCDIDKSRAHFYDEEACKHYENK